MKGLMMDYPLTLTQFFERSRRLFAKKTLATRCPGSRSSATRTPTSRSGRAARRRPGGARRAHGRPRRHLRVEQPPPSGALLGGPADGRGPAHAELPPLRRGPDLHHQPRRTIRVLFVGRQRLAGARAASGKLTTVRPVRDHPTIASPMAPAAVRGVRLRVRGRSSAGHAGRRLAPARRDATPRACATPPARPATPRASSTRTARSTCTAWPMAHGRLARRCPSSDVILHIVPMFHANAWCVPFAGVMVGSTQIFGGPNPQPRDICEIDPGREGHVRRRGAHRLDRRQGALRARRATTSPPSAASPSAARPRPGACIELSTRSSAPRCCTPGA